MRTRRENLIARYQSAARTGVAESSISCGGASVVRRPRKARVGDLCAHPTRICPPFLQSSLFAGSSFAAERRRAAATMDQTSSAPFLEFAGGGLAGYLFTRVGTSTGQRCMARGGCTGKQRQTGHAGHAPLRSRCGKRVGGSHHFIAWNCAIFATLSP